jgi:hypothetical protein
MPWKELGYAVGFVVVLASLYAGSYYWLIERVVVPGRIDGKYSNDAFVPVFYPMHLLDRRIRPDFWGL